MDVSMGSLRELFAAAPFGGNRLDMAEQLVQVMADGTLEYVVRGELACIVDGIIGDVYQLCGALKPYGQIEKGLAV